jgi:hypothetical protein
MFASSAPCAATQRAVLSGGGQRAQLRQRAAAAATRTTHYQKNNSKQRGGPLTVTSEFSIGKLTSVLAKKTQGDLDRVFKVGLTTLLTLSCSPDSRCGGPCNQPQADTRGSANQNQNTNLIQQAWFHVANLTLTQPGSAGSTARARPRRATSCRTWTRCWRCGGWTTWRTPWTSWRRRYYPWTSVGWHFSRILPKNILPKRCQNREPRHPLLRVITVKGSDLCKSPRPHRFSSIVRVCGGGGGGGFE